MQFDVTRKTWATYALGVALALVTSNLFADWSTTMPYEYKTISVLDSNMTYVDEGEGDAIVFLHGNPTSSYMWRNVMPHLEGQGRLIAVDYIGMGKSGKNPNGSYRFVDHYKYLDAFLKKIDVGDNVFFVTQSWGTALGFHWGYQNRERVKGYAYMEAHIRPRVFSEFTELEAGLLPALKTQGQGEEMILEGNIFVEQVLPGSILRKLTPEELAQYQAPYLEAGESRRPTLTWPREIPMDGKPEDVTKILNDFYFGWLLYDDSLPKLYFQTDPGLINSVILNDILRLPNQQVTKVKGGHIAPEDSPVEIGQAISKFVEDLRN